MKEDKEEKKNWKLKDFLKIVKKIFVAIFRGELLLRLDMGRFFAHILFLFFAMIMIIWGSLGIEATMSQVEKNRDRIEELRIIKSRNEFDIMSISRRSELARLLEEKGSKVTQREAPALNIKEEIKQK